MGDHHPALYATGRHGCWCWCRCGWHSGLYTTVTGAHVAFGRHLVDAATTARVAVDTVAFDGGRLTVTGRLRDDGSRVRLTGEPSDG